MKNLFNPVIVQETERRILRLGAESKRQWGSMELVQTLAHCTSGIEMAMGTIHARPAPILARVIGQLIKPFVFRDDQPMRRNSPSSPELFSRVPGEADFVAERSRLIQTLHNFASGGPSCCSHYPHPFFGRLKPEEWSVLAYKHLDHHLRQFGV